MRNFFQLKDIRYAKKETNMVGNEGMQKAEIIIYKTIGLTSADS